MIPTPDPVQRLVCKEIGGMTRLLIDLAIIGDLVLVERPDMAMGHRHPAVPPRPWAGAFTQMVFSEQPSSVAKATHLFGQRRQAVKGVPAFRPVFHLPVVDPAVHPMLRRQHPRQRRRPAGRTEGVRAKGVVEPRPLRRQSVQIGRVNFMIAIAAQSRGLLIIRHDQNDVRLFHISSPRQTRANNSLAINSLTESSNVNLNSNSRNSDGG